MLNVNGAMSNGELNRFFGSDVQAGKIPAMNDKITFTLCDPSHLYHTIRYEDDHWYGMENVAAAIDDSDLKWYTIRKLRQMMLVEIEGKWAGFEWVPID